jgi:hypothetical protein
LPIVASLPGVLIEGRSAAACALAEHVLGLLGGSCRSSGARAPPTCFLIFFDRKRDFVHGSIIRAGL